MHMRNPAATAVKRVAQKQRKGRLSFFIDFNIYIYIYIYIVYVIESAAYGVIFTSCLCENPNERGTSE